MERFGHFATAHFHRSSLACVTVVCLAWILPAQSVLATDWYRLENPIIGYSFSYPADWHVAGVLIGSEFANTTTSQCQGVEFKDIASPPGPGQLGQVLRSLVQVCGQPVADGQSLDEFMLLTYGVTLETQFQRTELACLHAYKAGSAGQEIYFLQTPTHRVQIITVVAAKRDIEGEHRSQIERILGSLAFRASGSCRPLR